MKTVIALCGVMACSLTGLCAEGSDGIPATGDPVEQITAVLGEPHGYMRIADIEVFLYERGRVEARAGVVTAVDLLSDAELAAYRIEQQRLQALREQERRERIREGQALKAQVLANPGFTTTPLADRLAFWQSFRHRYPGAGGEEEYARLFHEQQRELEVQRVEQRLAELERRTREAEARAQRAERKAEEARRQSTRWAQPVITPTFYPVIYTHRSYYRVPHGARRHHAGPPSRRGSSFGVRYTSQPYGWHWDTSRPSTFSISYRRAR